MPPRQPVDRTGQVKLALIVVAAVAIYGTMLLTQFTYLDAKGGTAAPATIARTSSK